MMENKHNFFTDIFDFSEIVIAEHGICDCGREEIKTIVNLFPLFFIIVFSMMKLPAKSKAGKFMIRESCKVTDRLNYISFHAMKVTL